MFVGFKVTVVAVELADGAILLLEVIEEIWIFPEIEFDEFDLDVLDEVFAGSFDGSPTLDAHAF